MNKNIKKDILKARRHARVRVKVSGNAERPRLNVFRSLKHVAVQLIDDVARKTLVSASDKEVKDAKTKTEKSEAVGKLVAEKALAKGINQVVFDKGASRYHGRVKAIADGARAAGLKI
ncbi:MAG: 50S ribosomal protein L18 [bacterium]